MELECFDPTAWNRYYSIFDKRCGFSLSSRTTFALSKLVLVQRLDKSRRLLKIENFKRQSHLFPQIPPQHIKFLGWHFEIPLSIQKGANLSSLQINPKQSTKTIVGYLFHEQAIIVRFQGFFCFWISSCFLLIWHCEGCMKYVWVVWNKTPRTPFSHYGCRNPPESRI